MPTTNSANLDAGGESARLAHHFDDLKQQHAAGLLGMWIFLVTELMFFGGLFAAYLVYRQMAPEVFAYASGQLDVVMGTTNTVVLLTSSFTMALAVHAAEHGNRRAIIVFLMLTIVLALAFFGIKISEYHHKYEQGLVPLLGLPFEYTGEDAGQVRLFYSLYFVMTGLHALHVLIGIPVMAAVAWMARDGRFNPSYYTPVEATGLYWHFVDIVWIFLFPLLYLIDRV